MAKQSKDDALVALLRDATGATATKSGYKRVLRACKTLELSEPLKVRVLNELAYARPDGTLYDWLKPKLADQPGAEHGSR